MPRTRVWRRRSRAAFLAVATVAAVLFVVLGVRSGRDDGIPLLPGTEPWGGIMIGGYALPRELTGFDAMVLRPPSDGRRYTLLGWRLRRIWPTGAPIAYRVRRLDEGGRCPDDHNGYEHDPADAREEGQRFPCPMERVGGQELRPGRRLALTGVYWESARPGGVTDMGSAEAILRRDDGHLFRAATEDRITTCAVGVRACARRERRHDADVSMREALQKPTYVCRAPARRPLFAAPGDRPPRPRASGRNLDLRGRPCVRAPE